MKTVLVIDLRTLIALGLIGVALLIILYCYIYDLVREWRRRRVKK